MKEKRAFVSIRKLKLSDPKSDLRALIEDLRARRQFVTTNCFLLLTLFAIINHSVLNSI